MPLFELELTLSNSEPLLQCQNCTSLRNRKFNDFKRQHRLLELDVLSYINLYFYFTTLTIASLSQYIMKIVFQF